MAVSIVENGQSALSTGTTGACTYAVSATPVATDVFYVLVNAPSSAGGGTMTVSTASGLTGITWSLVFERVFVSNQKYTLWKGTGATTAGTISGNYSSLVSRTYGMDVFLVRGLPAGHVGFVKVSSPWDTTENYGTGVSNNLSVPTPENSFVLGVNTASNAAYTWPSPGSTGGFTAMTRASGGSTYWNCAGQGFTTNQTPTNVVLGARQDLNGMYIPIDLFVFGGPRQRLLGEYAEALTSATSQRQLDAAYLEALAAGVPARQLNAAYLEVMAANPATVDRRLRGEYLEVLSNGGAPHLMGAYLEVITPAVLTSAYWDGWGLVIPA